MKAYDDYYPCATTCWDLNTATPLFHVEVDSFHRIARDFSRIFSIKDGHLYARSLMQGGVDHSVEVIKKGRSLRDTSYILSGGDRFFVAIERQNPPKRDVVTIWSWKGGEVYKVQQWRSNLSIKDIKIDSSGIYGWMLSSPHRIDPREMAPEGTPHNLSLQRFKVEASLSTHSAPPKVLSIYKLPPTMRANEIKPSEWANCIVLYQANHPLIVLVPKS